MDENEKLPQGWHLKKEFIDSEGNVYHKGVLQSDLKKQSLKTIETLIDKNMETNKETPTKRELELEDRLARLEGVISSNLSNSKPMTSNELAEAIATANSIQSGQHVYTPISSIDTDDYDEKGVEFICRQLTYVITDDKRGNYAVKPPLNNLIKFKFISGRVKNQNGVNVYSPISRYISHSKKEQKWLRESSFYNKIIFEKTETVIKDETELMFLFASKVGKYLDTCESSQILKLAKENSLSLAEPLDSIKKNLLIILTKKEIAKQKQIDANLNKLKLEESLFLQ